MTTAPATSAAIIDGVDVDSVAAAVTACPGVSALFGGRGDTIASYLPGRRVPGVEVSGDTVNVTVRSRWDTTAPDLLTQVSTAVSPILHGKRLNIIVADIDDPESTQTFPSAPALPHPVTPVSTVPEPHPVSSAAVEATTDTMALRAPGSAPPPSPHAPEPAPPHFPTP